MCSSDFYNSKPVVTEQYCCEGLLHMWAFCFSGTSLKTLSLDLSHLKLSHYL